MNFREEVTAYFHALQDSICAEIAHIDGGAEFEIDVWKRPEGGGGRTRILQNGNILEKAGVNFSAVEGELPPNIRKALELNESEFYATGVSIVMHPSNPHVPIIHMNVRYFEIENEVSWFGGGIDLTPHYVDVKDAKFFHTKLKEACEAHDPHYYESFKKWADDYFYISHRKETRGIGGIFFDRLEVDSKHTMLQRFDFVKSIAESFVPIYKELIGRSRDKEFTEAEKKWQLLRRGRYVEFNLVHDKGTKFGLQTNGRIESILMSLPDTASWTYNYSPDKNSKEARTLEMLKKGVDWI